VGEGQGKVDFGLSGQGAALHQALAGVRVGARRRHGSAARNPGQDQEQDRDDQGSPGTWQLFALMQRRVHKFRMAALGIDAGAGAFGVLQLVGEPQ
jgi:hypothetical protein